MKNVLTGQLFRMRNLSTKGMVRGGNILRTRSCYRWAARPLCDEI